MMVSVLHDIALHFFLFRPLITDSSLQSSENSSHCRNQPSANHPQVLGDEQSAKFTVLFPRARRQIEDGIKKKNICEERENQKFNCGRLCWFLFVFLSFNDFDIFVRPFQCRRSEIESINLYLYSSSYFSIQSWTLHRIMYATFNAETENLSFARCLRLKSPRSRQL